MPDYKKMYFKLYDIHCRVLDMLYRATLETEELAMEAQEPIVLENAEDEK